MDAHDIRNVTLESLREQISSVMQDVFLFNGSIKENIAYGKKDASEEEIIQAAQIACAHDFIMSMPEGYETYIGERGVRLSGGQKCSGVHCTRRVAQQSRSDIRRSYRQRR